MKNILSVLALSLLLVCGCGDKKDELAEDTVEAMEDFNEVLAGIQDEASAKAAKPKIEKIAKEMQALQKRGEEMKLTQAEKDAMEAKYKDRIDKATTEMGGHMSRIMLNPSIGPHLADAFEDMESSGADGGGMN